MVDASLALRVVHIAATCTSLGGLVYARAVLWPLLDTLPAAEREPFLQRAVRRFAAIKWTGVALLAITGVWQWALTWPGIADRRAYVAFFALKMAGAAGLFSITFLLSLPASRLEAMRARRGFWSGLNVLCGLAILVGAALMRTVQRA